MRLLFIVLAIIGSLVLWQGCKTTKHNLSDYEGDQLVFGSGGGFTGMVKELTVLPNGQLFKGFGPQPDEQEKIKRRKAKKLFKKAAKLDLINTKFNKPGNMYYFIRYKQGDQVNEITWGREKDKMNDAMDSLFQEFLELIPKSPTKENTTNY